MVAGLLGVPRTFAAEQPSVVPAWLKAHVGEATLSSFALNFAFGLPLSLAVALAWYTAFERPFLRARARLR
jgi:hypothetical protein